MAEVVVTAAFKRRYKPLAKRHRSLVQDVLGLIGSLEEHPVQGTPLGKDCYKIRLAVSSKSGGKSGGARVITYVIPSRNRTSSSLLALFPHAFSEGMVP